MKNNNKSYDERYAKLEAIEKATGEDMGFQKGVLDVRFQKIVNPKDIDDPDYSSYDAGVDFAIKKRYDLFQNNTNEVVNYDDLNVSKVL